MGVRTITVAVLVAALVAGCAAPDGDNADQTTPTADTDERVVRGVDVGGAGTDVFLPPIGIDVAPVVVMLHGTMGDRTRMHGLASAVAGDGALVYVPSWPVIDMAQPYPDDEGDEPYRRQSEAVICSLRGIRAEAAELGGDPDDLTVVGHSGGAMIGARVAMVDVPPWPGIGCDPDIDHAPQRFIGLGGDYAGWYQDARARYEDYAPYDLFALEATNDDLEVWLLHGNNDQTINAYVAHDFADRLAEQGVDAAVLTTDWAHAEPLDPGEPAGGFAADQITSIVRGDTSTVWTRVDADATLSFDDDERCEWTGPTSLARGGDVVIDLQNRTGVDIWFALVSVRSDAEVSDAALLDSEGDMFEDWPDWVEFGGLARVDPRSSATLRFALVEADQRFVAYCHPDPEAEHPKPNWMYTAAVLTPADG